MRKNLCQGHIIMISIVLCVKMYGVFIGHLINFGKILNNKFILFTLNSLSLWKKYYYFKITFIIILVWVYNNLLIIIIIKFGNFKDFRLFFILKFKCQKWNRLKIPLFIHFYIIHYYFMFIFKFIFNLIIIIIDFIFILSLKYLVFILIISIKLQFPQSF